MPRSAMANVAQRFQCFIVDIVYMGRLLVLISATEMLDEPRCAVADETF